MGLIQVCLPNSPVFSNSTGRFCFAKNLPEGIFSRLTCVNNLTTTTTTTLVPPTTTAPPKGQVECKSEACQRLSEAIVTRMNTSVDPCEDFYRFSCGSAKRHVWKYMEESVEEKLEVLLNEVEGVKHTLTQTLFSIFPEKKESIGHSTKTNKGGKNSWTQALLAFFRSCRQRSVNCDDPICPTFHNHHKLEEAQTTALYIK